MPQVPYSPVPEVSPQLSPTPGVRPNVSQDAFGGAEGIATQRLGGEFLQSGSQIMSRAIALQELNEQAAADNALTPVYDQIGERLKSFRSKSGLEASNDYQPFVKDIGDIIEKGKEGLTSEYAKQIYDRNTRHVRQVTVDGAGAHAGVEFKNYQIGTEQSRVDNAIRLVGMHPEDETTYRNAVAAIEKSQLHVFKGWGEDQTKDYVQTQKSLAAAERAKALNQTDFRAAQKFLDNAVKAGEIDGLQAGQIAAQIRNQRNTVVSRVEADKIVSGEGFHFGETKVMADRLYNAIIGIESSGNQFAKTPCVHKDGSRDVALGLGQVLQSNLKPWLKEFGMPDMTPEQFLADRDAQVKLIKSKLGQYYEKYGTANEVARHWRGLGKVDLTNGDTEDKYLRRFNQQLAKTASRGEVDDVTKRHAESLGLGADEEFNMHFRDHTNALLANDRRIAKEELQNNIATVHSAILGVPGEKLPISIDQINDPLVRQAYDALPQQEKAKVIKDLARNAEEVYAKTPENSRQYTQLMGAMLDENLPEELKDKLIDTNFAALKMPADMKRKLQAQKAKFMKGQGSDTRINWAMGVLRDKLERAGLSYQSDPEANKQFRGMLHEVLGSEAAATGTMPKDEKKIQEIGDRLLREIVTGKGWFGGDIKQKLFQADVPSDKRDAIARAFLARTGRTAEDKDIQQIWAFTQYQELYAKKQEPKK